MKKTLRIFFFILAIPTIFCTQTGDAINSSNLKILAMLTDWVSSAAIVTKRGSSSFLGNQSTEMSVSGTAGITDRVCNVIVQILNEATESNDLHYVFNRLLRTILTDVEESKADIVFDVTDITNRMSKSPNKPLFSDSIEKGKICLIIICSELAKAITNTTIRFFRDENDPFVSFAIRGMVKNILNVAIDCSCCAMLKNPGFKLDLSNNKDVLTQVAILSATHSTIKTIAAVTIKNIA
jgi:hypothetical protein